MSVLTKLIWLAKKLHYKTSMLHYFLIKFFQLFPKPFIAILIKIIHRFKYEDFILQFPRFCFAVGVSR